MTETPVTLARLLKSNLPVLTGVSLRRIRPEDTEVIENPDVVMLAAFNSVI